MFVCANFLFCHLRYPIAILGLQPFGLETEDATTTIMWPDEQEHDTCGIQCEISLSLDVCCSSTPPSHHWCLKYAFVIRPLLVSLNLRQNILDGQNNRHANFTNASAQTRPRHPHTPPRFTQMLPHDQRRARRAYRW
jgi:hypothetical protein